MTSAEAASSTICPSCQQSQSDADADFCQNCRFPLIPIANKYRLEQLLNEGGFSHVYLARHMRLKRNAERVIKIIKGDLLQRDPSMEERFYREVQMTADLSHQCQHVVRVFDDFGDAPKLGHYYVMEYLQGGTLAELMKSAQELLSFEVAVHIASQLCDAMHWAHKSDIVHRDLKPANIMLIDYEGDAHYVKVLDFGIAKSFAEEHAEGKQFTQGAIGTPTYMAPEHFKGGEVDFRGDLYSLGVIFYELLAGRPPFIRQKNFQSAMIEMMEYHTHSPVPPLQEFRPDIPPALAEAVHKALEKRPEDRFGSAREFKEALQAALAPMQPHASHTGLAIPAATASGSFPQSTPSGAYPASPSGSFASASSHTPAPFTDPFKSTPSGSFSAPPPDSFQRTSSGSFSAASTGSFKSTPPGSFSAPPPDSIKKAQSGSFTAATGSFPPRSPSGAYPSTPSGSFPPPPPKRKTGTHAAKPPPPPPSYSRSSMPAVGHGNKADDKPKGTLSADDTHIPGHPDIPSPTAPVKKPILPKEILPPQPFKSAMASAPEESGKSGGKISLRLDNRMVEGAQITMDPQAEPLTIDDIEEVQSEDDLDSTAVLTADDITMSFRRKDESSKGAKVLSTEDITTAHLTRKVDLGATGILTAEDMTTETRRMLDDPDAYIAAAKAAQAMQPKAPVLGSHATPFISSPEGFEPPSDDPSNDSAGTSPNLAPTSVEPVTPMDVADQVDADEKEVDPATAALMKLLDPLAPSDNELGVADTTIQANPFLSDPLLFELATGTRPPDLRPDDAPQEAPDAGSEQSSEDLDAASVVLSDESTPEENEDAVEASASSTGTAELSSLDTTSSLEEVSDDNEEASEAAEPVVEDVAVEQALAAVENSFTTVTPPPPSTPEAITAEYFGSFSEQPSTDQVADSDDALDAPATFEASSQPDLLSPAPVSARISEQETTKVHGIQVPMELLTGEISEDQLDGIASIDISHDSEDVDADKVPSEATPELKLHDEARTEDNEEVQEDDDDALGSAASSLEGGSSTIQFHPNLPLPPMVETPQESDYLAPAGDAVERSTLEYDQPVEALPGPSFDDVLAEDEGIAMSSVTVGFETPAPAELPAEIPDPFSMLDASDEEASETDNGANADDATALTPQESASVADLLGPDMYHQAISDAELMSMDALLDQAAKATAPPPPAPTVEAGPSEEQSTMEVRALSLDGDDPFGLLEDDEHHAGDVIEAGTIEAGTMEAGTIEAESLEASTLDAGTLEEGEREAGTFETGTVEEATPSAFSDAPEPPFGQDPFARFSDNSEIHTLDGDQSPTDATEQPDIFSSGASSSSALDLLASEEVPLPPSDATQEISAPSPAALMAMAEEESSEDEIQYPSMVSTDHGTVPSTQAVTPDQQHASSGGKNINMPIIVLMLVGGVLLLIGAFMML